MTQLFLGKLIEGPKHGYRLKQDAAMFAGTQQLHNNTVYPLLKFCRLRTSSKWLRLHSWVYCSPCFFMNPPIIPVLSVYGEIKETSYGAYFNQRL